MLPRVRLSLLVLFTLSLVAALAFRVVRGDRREVDLAVALADRLAVLEDLTAGATVVRVNGAELHRSTSYTGRSVSEVLERLDAYCHDGASLLDEAVKDLPAALEVTEGGRGRGVGRRGVGRRWDNGTSGFTLCLVAEDGTSGDSLRDRLAAFLASGDLSLLGRVRYFHVEKGARTRVVALWTRDAIDLAKMFPSNGDAPGEDSTLTPRPLESRRTLSVSAENLPRSMRTYETSARLDAVTSAYDAEMNARGFTRIVTPWARFYKKGDERQVIFTTSREGEKTKVTIVEIDVAGIFAPRQRTTS